MVLTANIEFGKWGTVLADDKLASTLVDGIVYHGRLVEFKGEAAASRIRSCWEAGRKARSRGPW